MQGVRSMTAVQRCVAAGAAIALALTACGGDDDTNGDGAAAADSEASESDAQGVEEGGDGGDGAADAGDAGNSGGSGGGSMVLGDETIDFDSARCYLQEQDAAAGGGKILFVAQASGSDAAGEEVLLDVSRYDEDSQFVGDDILVDIGDFTSDDSVGLRAKGEIGMVTVDGSNVSADDLTFVNFDDLTELPGSFEINC